MVSSADPAPAASISPPLTGTPTDGEETEAEAPPPEPFQTPGPGPWLGASAPAVKYSNLSPSQCRHELKKRSLPVRRAGAARGIANALRITGPIGDVMYRVAPAPSPFGLLDCRLALTLADFSELLRAHAVTAVRVDNMYRPGTRLPGRRKKSQHGYGLAIDVVSFTLEDGTVLSVEDDWGSPLGSTPCGPQAIVHEPSARALRLRNLVCETARAGFFHHLLSPSYDAAHRNHLHLDIQRDAKHGMLRD